MGTAFRLWAQVTGVLLAMLWLLIVLQYLFRGLKWAITQAAARAHLVVRRTTSPAVH